MKFLGKFSRLSNVEQKIRLSLLDWCLEHGGELPREQAILLVEDIFEKYPDERGDWTAETILDSMDEKHYFRCTKEKAICYVYPYSAYPTDYKVTLEDGRSFYAMCAIDSMGSAVTFHQPLSIVSHCKDTKEEIRLEVDPERGLTNVSPDRNLIATYYDTIGNWKEFNC